jgi:hypothetical protein
VGGGDVSEATIERQSSPGAWTQDRDVTIATAIAMACLAVLVWFAKGFADNVRSRVVSQVLSWFLRQLFAFRLACHIARLARAIAPAKVAHLARGDLWMLAGLTWKPAHWESPAAAISLLEEDLRDGRTIKDPCALVWPLVSHALWMRGRNISHRVALPLAASFTIIALFILGFLTIIFVVIVAPALAVLGGVVGQASATNRWQRLMAKIQPGREAWPVFDEDLTEGEIEP